MSETTVSTLVILGVLYLCGIAAAAVIGAADMSDAGELLERGTTAQRAERARQYLTARRRLLWSPLWPVLVWHHMALDARRAHEQIRIHDRETAERAYHDAVAWLERNGNPVNGETND
ncbi:hypothetical protein [Micrococcus luteus]|uniref:hypothetical protein n=1 Tax=Micrococcus luteus TaxID=1270 RepID=UPI003D728745